MQSLKRLAGMFKRRSSRDIESFLNISDSEMMSKLSNAHFRVVMPGEVRKLYDIPTSVSPPYYLTRPIDTSKGALSLAASTFHFVRIIMNL